MSLRAWFATILFACSGCHRSLETILVFVDAGDAGGAGSLDTGRNDAGSNERRQAYLGPEVRLPGASEGSPWINLGYSMSVTVADDRLLVTQNRHFQSFQLTEAGARLETDNPVLIGPVPASSATDMWIPGSRQLLVRNDNVVGKLTIGVAPAFRVEWLEGWFSQASTSTPFTTMAMSPSGTVLGLMPLPFQHEALPRVTEMTGFQSEGRGFVVRHGFVDPWALSPQSMFFAAERWYRVINDNRTDSADSLFIQSFSGLQDSGLVDDSWQSAIERGPVPGLGCSSIHTAIGESNLLVVCIANGVWARTVSLPNPSDGNLHWQSNWRELDPRSSHGINVNWNASDSTFVVASAETVAGTSVEAVTHLSRVSEHGEPLPTRDEDLPWGGVQLASWHGHTYAVGHARDDIAVLRVGDPIARATHAPGMNPRPRYLRDAVRTDGGSVLVLHGNAVSKIDVDNDLRVRTGAMVPDLESEAVQFFDDNGVLAVGNDSSTYRSATIGVVSVDSASLSFGSATSVQLEASSREVGNPTVRTLQVLGDQLFVYRAGERQLLTYSRGSGMRLNQVELPGAYVWSSATCVADRCVGYRVAPGVSPAMVLELGETPRARTWRASDHDTFPRCTNLYARRAPDGSCNIQMLAPFPDPERPYECARDAERRGEVCGTPIAAASSRNHTVVVEPQALAGVPTRIAFRLFDNRRNSDFIEALSMSASGPLLNPRLLHAHGGYFVFLYSKIFETTQTHETFARLVYFPESDATE